MRYKVRIIVADLQANGFSHSYLNRNDRVMDLWRLTCMEEKMFLDKEPMELCFRPWDRTIKASFWTLSHSKVSFVLVPGDILGKKRIKR